MSFNIDDEEPRRTRVRWKATAATTAKEPQKVVDSPDWMEISQQLLATLLPYPEARHAVIEALKARSALKHERDD